MSAPRLRLTTSQRDGLAQLLELGPNLLSLLAERLESQTFTIRREVVEKTIVEIAGPERGPTVARLLFGLAGSFRRSFMTPDDLVAGIGNAVETVYKNEARFSAWSDCKDAVLRLLTVRSLALAAKAIDISYDFERVYTSGRVLTSIRPVFDEDRDALVGSTVVQTLRIDYVSSGGDAGSISLALDLNDVKNLQDACEAAIRKAGKSKEKIEASCKFEVIIPGEESVS